MSYTTHAHTAEQQRRLTQGLPAIIADISPHGDYNDGLGQPIVWPSMLDYTARWVTSNSSPSLVPSTGYPTSRLYDGYTHLGTRPDTGSDSTWLELDLGAACRWDTLWLKLKHGTSLPSSVILYADGTYYFVGYRDLPDVNTGRPGSWSVCFSMGDIYDCRYVWVLLTGQDAAHPTEVTECIIGTRWHVPVNLPYDQLAADLEIAESKTARGMVGLVGSRHARRVVSARATITPGSIANISAASAETQFDAERAALLSQTLEPFLWVDNPATSGVGERAHLMIPSGRHALTQESVESSLLAIAGTEQLPGYWSHYGEA